MKTHYFTKERIEVVNTRGVPEQRIAYRCDCGTRWSSMSAVRVHGQELGVAWKIKPEHLSTQELDAAQRTRERKRAEKIRRRVGRALSALERIENEL